MRQSAAKTGERGVCITYTPSSQLTLGVYFDNGSGDERNFGSERRRAANYTGSPSRDTSRG